MASLDKLLLQWKRFGLIEDGRVFEAFRKVNRELFVPKSAKSLAWVDTPLPLLRGQTISQPTTVAIMTQALRLKPGMQVLEVGSGSGWQAGIIGFMVGQEGKVFTIEIIPELVNLARRNLKQAGLGNVSVIQGDGGYGLAREAPYDRIIMTCAAKDFPIPLVTQLKDKGIILGPLGGRLHQTLVRATKQGNRLKREKLGGFVFVPLLGDFG